MTYILGISCYYHDSAAALLADGKIVAAAQEERFTRKKHDPSFPTNAIGYCLDEAGIAITDIEKIVFYDKPLLKFERLIETYLSFAPKGFTSFLRAMPVWLKEKLFIKQTLRKELAELAEIETKAVPPLHFTEHHESHAASAFFASPYEQAAVLCLDGVGEWATTTAWSGMGNRLTPLWEVTFPHSLGLLYSAFTYYIGFKVNSGEYKLMGLAPYGTPRFADKIREHLIDIKEDGTFRLNMDYFDFATGLRMTNDAFHDLFGGEPRQPESALTEKEMDIAASIQVVTEEVVLRLAKTLKKETGMRYLCLAGGVALNCVANGRILREAGYDDIWIQPAAGDAGGALGAALAQWHHYDGNSRHTRQPDSMQGAYLGPSFSDEEIFPYLDSVGATYERAETEDDIVRAASNALTEGAVLGWFQGRMEYGPRALCHRSIIGDPRVTEMQEKMNLKIKFRESFRPFAPVVREENIGDYFDIDRPSPYMLLVAQVKKQHHEQVTGEARGVEKVKQRRSSVPAITHVDHSARIQSLSKDSNPRFHKVMTSFYERTGCPVLVNTSFNVRGEPIVCTPEDGYMCFLRTDMDYLIIGSAVLRKQDQSQEAITEARKQVFAKD